MKAILLVFTVLLGFLLMCTTSAQAQAPEYLPLRQFISRKRSPGFVEDNRNLIRFGDNWLMPFKIFQKRGFSGFPYDDEDVLIPLMKKGRPRGPPRFGKRSGGMGAPIHQRPMAFYRLYPDHLDDVNFNF